MSTAETTVARYLGAAGAHVTVTRNDALERFTAACEAHGYVNGSGYLGATGDDAFHAQRHAERHAEAHAGTCRKLPERLWPEGGALK